MALCNMKSNMFFRKPFFKVILKGKVVQSKNKCFTLISSFKKKTKFPFYFLKVKELSQR